MNNVHRHPTLILALILIIGAILRLYQFTTPLADWHSFRQADTVSVAREYVKHGINLLEPRYHDLSNIQSGQENPQGYRMVEFPFINATVAKVYQLIPIMELHQWYRMISIIFSLGVIVLLYLLGTQIDTKKVGLIAGAVFAFLPYSIYYSRTTLPEIPLLFFALLSMNAFVIYSNTHKYRWIVLFTFSFLLSLLLKPTAIFFLPPLLTYILIQQKISLKNLFPWMLASAISLVPLLLWRSWIQAYPAGIPVFDRLLNAVTVVDTAPIRFRPAFFRWIFAERIAKLILGYYGAIFVVLGFLWPLSKGSSRPNIQKYASMFRNFLHKLTSPNTLNQKHQATLFYLVWSFSMFAYLSIFAAGNVQHDYYQIILLPIISLLVARGIMFFWDIHTILSFGIALICIVSMLGFSWYEVKGYFNINNWAMVRAGQAVDRLTPEDALIIAPYMGDTAFLYQTNRKGWPLGLDIENNIKNGADYYVSTSYDDEARELEEQYTLVEKTDEYILIQLK